MRLEIQMLVGVAPMPGTNGMTADPETFEWTTIRVVESDDPALARKVAETVLMQAVRADNLCRLIGFHSSTARPVVLVSVTDDTPRPTKAPL
jgi:hypothetical protein